MPNQAPVRDVNETREMRLISVVLADRGPLSGYLARRRLPGETWMTWEQIAYELQQFTGEAFTRAGITNWAERYGIPIASRPGDDPAAYLAALTEAGLSVRP